VGAHGAPSEAISFGAGTYEEGQVQVHMVRQIKKPKEIKRTIRLRTETHAPFPA
jgi:hypothetical protein